MIYLKKSFIMELECLENISGIYGLNIVTGDMLIV